MPEKFVIFLAERIDQGILKGCYGLRMRTEEG
jgi:hypothetical protein